MPRNHTTLAPRAARLLLVVGVLAGLAGLAACGGQRVTRMDPSAVTDLSGRWNDTDSRLVANELIRLSLEGPWLPRFTDGHGGQAPTVIVGDFRNRSMEHVPVNTFLRDLESAYVSSGAVRVVARRAERDEIRDERRDQQEHARADTRSRIGQELGARYILQGEIQSIQDQERGERVVFYQVDATLVDLESNERVWVGQHKIKKAIQRSRWGF
jgi:penicillin-binding protein activator